ncbi:MAG: transposase [Candidatus Cloacimonadota bacterium]|nr:transposase [Candidatus Cloacimonadota bacterium]
MSLNNSILNHYLPLYFPEAEKYFCSARANWFAKFFYEFPCPLAITQYSLEEFIKESSGLAGRKVDKRNWLKDVYKTAGNSIGLPIAPNSKTIDMFKLTLNDFSQLCSLRANIEQQIDDYLSDNDDYHRLKTVPGIGPIIAVTILSEAGDIRRFGHVRQFLKFCGFDLKTKQSGTFRGKSTLSKRGNADLRKMFWLASTIAIRMRENTFRKKYENYIKESPKNADIKRKAYVAVAAKIARVVYSMITHNTDYYCTHESQ